MSGSLNPVTDVLGPSNTSVCGAFTSNDDLTCSLSAGTHTVRVRDNLQTSTGTYRVSVARRER